MDILEPVVKDLFGHSLAVELDERREELLCDIGLNDLLAFEHQHMGDIHQHIRIGNTAVGSHGREKTHHLPRPLARKASQSHNIGPHPFTLILSFIVPHVCARID